MEVQRESVHEDVFGTPFFEKFLLYVNLIVGHRVFLSVIRFFHFYAFFLYLLYFLSFFWARVNKFMCVRSRMKKFKI